MNFVDMALQALEQSRADRALVYATLATVGGGLEASVAQAAVNFIQHPSPETFSELSQLVEEFVGES